MPELGGDHLFGVCPLFLLSLPQCGSQTATLVPSVELPTSFRAPWKCHHVGLLGKTCKATEFLPLNEHDLYVMKG